MTQLNSIIWIKNAMAKEASIAGFKSQHGDLPFEIVDECCYVDFFTKDEEIATIIKDDSGLQIFAILTLAQKFQVLSNIEAVSLDNLHLRCLQYKFEMRHCDQKKKTDVVIDVFTPGVDYQIVLILIEIENNGIGDQEKQICNYSLPHWYYECNECRIFASTIRANVMIFAAAEENDTTPEELSNSNSIADKQLGEKKNVLVINICDSQEPQWVNSSTVSYSQCTQKNTIRENLMALAAEEIDTKTEELSGANSIADEQLGDQQNVLPINILDSEEPQWAESSTVHNSQGTPKSTIRENLMALVAEENDTTTEDLSSSNSIADEQLGDQQNVPAINILDSEEPQWAESSTVPNSQCTPKSTIRENLMALIAEENDTTTEELLSSNSFADEQLGDQQNVPAINILDSEEPQWAESSTVPNSQCTSNLAESTIREHLMALAAEDYDTTTEELSDAKRSPEWRLTQEGSSRERNAKPTCSHTKPSVEMEKSRLNELMRPSSLSKELCRNFSLDEAPWEPNSPGIVMEEDVLDTVLSNSTVVVEMQDDISLTQVLSSTGNSSDKLYPAAYVTLDSCESFALETDLEPNSPSMTSKDDNTCRPTTNQEFETPKDVSTNPAEHAHLDNANSRVLNTVLDDDESTAIGNSSHTELVETGDPNVTLGLVAASPRSTCTQNTKLFLETPSEGNKEHNSAMNLENRSPDLKHEGVLRTDLEQNLACQNEQLNSDLAETACNGHTETVGVLQNEQNVSDGCENTRTTMQQVELVLEQILHRNPIGQTSPERLLNQPMVRQPPDKIPRKRKRRKTANVMYPIPVKNSFEMFDTFRCLSTFFIVPSNETGTDSSSDEECENGIPRQTHTITANTSNPSVQQNQKHINGPLAPTQHKSNTILVINEEFRNGLIQHLGCSSTDSDSSESTPKVPRTSKVTQRRNILKRQRDSPKDLQVSPEMRFGLLKSIFSDL